MACLLNIETATTVCSVCICENDKVIASKELDDGFTHAENLHVFIQDVLKQTGLGMKDLDAVSVSKGPGSYTGLRIGVSAAKGIAYALSIPIIAVDTLQIMAVAASTHVKEKTHYVPLIDARRMEVYTSVYDDRMLAQSPVEALIVDETSIRKFAGLPSACFFGDGMPKCRELLKTLDHASFIEGIRPGAQHMSTIAFEKFTRKQFEHTAYFEPYYLKDFMITTKKSAP